MAIGPQEQRRERLLLIAFLFVMIFMGVVLYNRFLKPASLETSLPPLPILEGTLGPLNIPFDFFDTDTFRNLRSYTPLSPSEAEHRVNPFVSQ